MDTEVNTHGDSALLVHAVFVAAAGLGAAIAVPVFYANRMSEPLFVIGLLGFIGCPLFVAVMYPDPSRIFLALAAALLLSCPVVYVVMDHWEIGRDSYFLFVGIDVIFVGATWAIDGVRRRLSTRALTGVLGAMVGMGAVFIMIWMYLFFE